MAYPTTLDSFNDPQATDRLNNPSHSALHQSVNTAVEGLEAIVGVTGSAINTTHTFKLAGVADGDYAASLTGTETLTNKRLTTPQFNEGVNMTATSTELNKLDGFTGDHTDLNKLDGVTDGTVSANKVVIADASKDVSFGTGDITATDITAIGNIVGVDIDSSGDLGIGGTWNIGGTAVNASAAELDITDGGETTEKVLNTQAKCRVYRNGVQSISSGSGTKVQLNAETYDIGGDFDTSNHRFTAPVTGYYLVVGSVQIDGMTDAHRLISNIYVNGANYAESSGHASYTQDMSAAVSDICYVTAGQYIELYVYQDTGGNKNLIGNAATQTFLSIHLLSV